MTQEPTCPFSDAALDALAAWLLDEIEADTETMEDPQ